MCQELLCMTRCGRIIQEKTETVMALEQLHCFELNKLHF